MYASLSFLPKLKRCSLHESSPAGPPTNVNLKLQVPECANPLWMTGTSALVPPPVLRHMKPAPFAVLLSTQELKLSEKYGPVGVTTVTVAVTLPLVFVAFTV